MNENDSLRRGAIRYWERRRIVYNLALVPPTIFSYMITGVLMYVGDPHQTYPSYVFALVALSALGANICYSLAYALEFFFGSNDPASRWLRFGRPTVLVAGILFAMVLAFIGGRNIAVMEFYGHPRPGM